MGKIKISVTEEEMWAHKLNSVIDNKNIAYFFAVHGCIFNLLGGMKIPNGVEDKHRNL